MSKVVLEGTEALTNLQCEAVIKALSEILADEQSRRETQREPRFTNRELASIRGALGKIDFASSCVK